MKPTIEVLIGSPLVGEEARFLVRLCSDLSQSNNSNSILVLANFEVPAAIKSRQLDFLVISDSNRGLVELKCFHGPVFGGENGVWKLRDFSGQSVPYPGENPWTQTVQAKFALSDAMSDFSRGCAGIPSPVNQGFYKEFDATVCIFPNIHPRSRITTGNFKAWVRGYNDFLAQFNKRTVHSNWTLDHWRRLAIEGLSLRSVPLQQAIDPDALVAADSIGMYCSALGSSLRQLPIVRAWPKGQTYGEDVIQRLSGSDNVSPPTNIQLLCHGTVGTAVCMLITSHREVLVILLILILCVFRDAESTRKCSGVHETSIANLLETRMNTG